MLSRRVSRLPPDPAGRHEKSMCLRLIGEESGAKVGPREPNGRPQGPCVGLLQSVFSCPDLTNPVRPSSTQASVRGTFRDSGASQKSVQTVT